MMEDLAYLAAFAGCVVSAFAARWIIRRSNMSSSRLKRVIAGMGGVLAGSVAYFLVGVLLALVRPEHSQQIVATIRSGYGLGSKLIMFAAIIVTFGRVTTKTIEPQPEGDVRERLLKARSDIQSRIEGLQTHPVLDYRGGVPERDLIIEELVEKLKEIEAALATLKPSASPTLPTP
jgi:hypothetical protein